MTEAFVYTETDRTKSRWVARAYQDYVRQTGRSRTTLRGLFYHALQMKASDYPICGGFVGEIRITRPYHESDGEKLAKWMGKARAQGFIPAHAILEETEGEQVFLPEEDLDGDSSSLEVWVSKSALNPLLYPLCQKQGAALVSVKGRASDETVLALLGRCARPTKILCLSDLSPAGAFFGSDLAAQIDTLGGKQVHPEIKVVDIGLRPQQVVDLKLPMVTASLSQREEQSRFKSLLKPYSLDPKKMAELDSLEVHYPGGIAGFLDDFLSQIKGT
ncbi:MAG: hypothetical protein LUQ44_04945 [Methanothrix sp.]|nr:hypothetical protein [Methanothrix sp.]